MSDLFQLGRPVVMGVLNVTPDSFSDGGRLSGSEAAIARGLAAPALRPPLVWLEFQGCTGDSESFLRAGNPTVAQILLETLSVNYHETLMVPSGRLATTSRRKFTLAGALSCTDCMGKPSSLIVRKVSFLNQICR